MNRIERLISKWRAAGLELPAGASRIELEAFEQRFQVRLPADFRDYIAAADGMGEYEFLDERVFLLRFWALREVCSIATLWPDRAHRFADAHSYFIFADHSIGLSYFAIRLCSDPDAVAPIARIYADVGALEVTIDFKSFSHFVDSYLHDPLATSVGIAIPEQ